VDTSGGEAPSSPDGRVAELHQRPQARRIAEGELLHVEQDRGQVGTVEKRRVLQVLGVGQVELTAEADDQVRGLCACETCITVSGTSNS
jgi:hypothetical protein